jgi:hypothetical protein
MLLEQVIAAARRSVSSWHRAAVPNSDLLSRAYGAAIERGYLWHEFGDSHLIIGATRGCVSCGDASSRASRDLPPQRR